MPQNQGMGPVLIAETNRRMEQAFLFARRSRRVVGVRSCAIQPHGTTTPAKPEKPQPGSRGRAVRLTRRAHLGNIEVTVGLLRSGESIALDLDFQRCRPCEMQQPS